MPPVVLYILVSYFIRHGLNLLTPYLPLSVPAGNQQPFLYIMSLSSVIVTSLWSSLDSTYK